MRQGPLDVLGGWARPILAAAAVLLALLGEALPMRCSTDRSPRNLPAWRRHGASPCSARSSSAHGRAPSGCGAAHDLAGVGTMSWAARWTAVILLARRIPQVALAGWLPEDVMDDIHGWAAMVGLDAPTGATRTSRSTTMPKRTFSRPSASARDNSIGGSPPRPSGRPVGGRLELPGCPISRLWSTRDAWRFRTLLTPEQRAAYDRWLGAQSGPNQP